MRVGQIPYGPQKLTLALPRQLLADGLLEVSLDGYSGSRCREPLDRRTPSASCGELDSGRQTPAKRVATDIRELSNLRCEEFWWNIAEGDALFMQLDQGVVSNSIRAKEVV